MVVDIQLVVAAGVRNGFVVWVALIAVDAEQVEVAEAELEHVEPVAFVLVELARLKFLKDSSIIPAFSRSRYSM